MKKFSMAALLILTAGCLAGCVDSTATVIYEEEPSPLTTMTFDTALPPETYSEYMATYSGTSETDTDDEQFFLRYGIQADTGITAPEGVSDGERTSLSRDTAPAKGESQGAVRDTAATSVTAVTTAPPEPGESGTETCVTGSETGSVTTTVTTLIRPEADTGKAPGISADTAPTKFVPETTATVSDGTDE